MLAKYGVYDGKELQVNMNFVKQKLRQHVHIYYDKLERLFVKGKILDVERKKRFLTHLRSEIKNLCVVHTYVDMDGLLSTLLR
jgi:hypothetical protein